MAFTNYQKKFIKLYKKEYPKRRAYTKKTDKWTKGFKTFMRKQVRKNPATKLFTEPDKVFNVATGGFSKVLGGLHSFFLCVFLCVFA